MNIFACLWMPSSQLFVADGFCGPQSSNLCLVVFGPYNSGGVSFVEEETPEQASGQTSEMKLVGGPLLCRPNG